MKKRLLSITAVALAIIMLLGAFPLSVSAEETYSVRVTVVGNGTVEVTPADTGVTEGTQISLLGKSEEDSIFDRYECTDSKGAPVELKNEVFYYTFNMPADNVYVTAYFDKRPKIDYIWLNDDETTLDTKSVYVGTEAPTTDKTPTKANDPDGKYVFEKWEIKSESESRIVYSPVFRDTTKGAVFVDMSIRGSKKLYSGDSIIFSGYLKDIGTGELIGSVEYTCELIYDGEVVKSMTSYSLPFDMMGNLNDVINAPEGATPGDYTLRFYYNGEYGEAQCILPVTIYAPTHLNIEATSPHQVPVNQNIVYEGTVTYDDGTPASNIEIGICSTPSFGYVWSRTTNEEGMFNFTLSSDTEKIMPLYFKPMRSEYTSEIASAVTYVYSGNHTVTVQNAENGRVTADKSSAKCGDTVNLTVTPDEGYKFKEWEVVSGGVNIENNSFTMETNDVVLKPVFEVYYPTIEIDLGDLGEPIVIETTYGKAFFNALLDANVWGPLHDMETEDYLFRDIATKPLGEFSDMDEYSNDTDELIDRPVKEDLHVYACFFTKIKNVALTIEYPHAGDAVTLDENYIQSLMPEFTVPEDANCHIIIDEYSRPEWWIVTGKEYPSFFEGTFEEGITYSVSALLDSDFGYWLDSNTAVTVNGEAAEEVSGALAIYFSKDFTVKEKLAIGDVNGDKSVDVLDALMIQKYAVDKTALTDEQLYAADVNNDGSVDILDAADIQKFAVDKIKEFKKKA